MRLDIWYFLVFCFQIKVLAGEINDSAKYEMFTFHNGGVQILCKYSEIVKQFKMQLKKGKQTLCDLSKTKGSGHTISTGNLKSCQPQLANNSVIFSLNNLESDHGYYFCNLSIFDPPPFQIKIISGEYLHIHESRLCCQLKFWLPIGCGVFVAVCMFGCICVFWFTKKKYGSTAHDPNSEYMFMAAVKTAKKTRLADVTS
ncbi:inducible T-cell costimulator [Thomomys bottae]